MASATIMEANKRGNEKVRYDLRFGDTSDWDFDEVKSEESVIKNFTAT